MKEGMVRLMVKSHQSNHYHHLITILSKKEETKDVHLKIEYGGFSVKVFLIIPNKVI